MSLNACTLSLVPDIDYFYLLCKIFLLTTFTYSFSLLSFNVMAGEKVL